MPEAEAGARADVVVGLTSHHDARTIGDVARAFQGGLARYCPGRPVRFVLADAGSNDGTREALREAVGAESFIEVACERGADVGTLPYHGHPGRAAGLKAIAETAQRLEASACLIAEAGLLGVTPEWIERLIVPVLDGTLDHVSPYYARHVTEGAITRSIIYPMFRSLYGVRLHQPAASEFACSARLLARYLEQDFWYAEQATVGIDLWLAVVAASGDFRTGEALLGPRRVQLPGAPADLSTTLAQVVGALFADLESRVDVWQRVRGSSPIPAIGTRPAPTTEPPELEVDALIESFRLGYRELRDIWTHVLPARTIVDLRRLTVADHARFRFDDRLWADIVYDFALGYGFRVMPHDHLLRSLTPLYNGWLASFVLEMQGADAAEVDDRVERVCLGFEAEKRHLISRWRWPERLR